MGFKVLYFDGLHVGRGVQRRPRPLVAGTLLEHLQCCERHAWRAQRRFEHAQTWHYPCLCRQAKLLIHLGAQVCTAMQALLRSNWWTTANGQHIVAVSSQTDGDSGLQAHAKTGRCT